MEFRDLKRQYHILREELDAAMMEICQKGEFIQGLKVREIEKKLAEYVGVKHCITCANGTDALMAALMVWGIGKGDAVFVPDFTFFSTGEAPAFLGATPIFVDISEDTYNMDPDALEKAVCYVLEKTDLKPKAVIAVDLFGLPAAFDKIHSVAGKYHLHVLEDAAQGFGGEFQGKKACSFGEIATTSFFPAKPLGCYGDGGAVFTQSDEWAERIRSICVHGRGRDKYDNIRIGMNSRLDTLQAAVLEVKLKAFVTFELGKVNEIARKYNESLEPLLKIPVINRGYFSSWAQYTVQLQKEMPRELFREELKKQGIPTAVYYAKPMHTQKAFQWDYHEIPLEHTQAVCGRVVSLPIHPYLSAEETEKIIETVKVLCGE